MQKNPAYFKPDDQTIAGLKAMAAIDIMPMSLCGEILGAFNGKINEERVPIAVLRYTFGPIIVHVAHPSPGNKDLGWLTRDVMDRWRPRVYVERLEILTGERAQDIVSPTELMLVMYNALSDAPCTHDISMLYLWAAHRALAAAGKPVEDSLKLMRNSLDEPYATDAQVFEGYLNHTYRRLCDEIIRKVVNHSKIGRK